MIVLLGLLYRMRKLLDYGSNGVCCNFNLGHAEPLTGAEACDPLQAQAPALRPFAEGHS